MTKIESLRQENTRLKQEVKEYQEAVRKAEEFLRELLIEMRSLKCQDS